MRIEGGGGEAQLFYSLNYSEYRRCSRDRKIDTQRPRCMALIGFVLDEFIKSKQISYLQSFSLSFSRPSTQYYVGRFSITNFIRNTVISVSAFLRCNV